jgi:tetratricopeptide (TPR) repeat protein
LSACLDDNVIAALASGALDGDERARVIEHLDECATCRTLVADVVRGSAAPTRSVCVPGTRVGRYVVLETVGAGAMGVVHAAYDTELRRKVALKLLRGAMGEARSSHDATARLLGEAHALAKLAHPNVVTIYDAGTFDDEVFIAMELVEGGTLGDWLAAHPPPRATRSVLALLVQAGEGLAAAHAAGFEHRDFKPDNVLVGGDGRARVTDFGLARAIDGAHEGSNESAAPASDEGRSDARLTQTGALVGTPAYMAPERLAGRAGDARSDQFSFCVALYEALHGERPFDGDDVASLSRSIALGRVRPAPANARVPAWLRRIVVRGLALDPAERFSSMRQLLDAIAAGARGRPRSSLVVALVLASAALIVAAVVRGARRAPAPVVCGGAEKAWAGAWDAARAGAVRAAFDRSGRPSASFAFNEVQRSLDDYRAAWLSAHRETCEATRVRGEQSEALLDRRMQCLDDRRRQVDALAKLLASADGAVVDKSIGAALSVPAVSGCANVAALGATVPPPADSVRATVDELRDRFAEASALDYAGQYAQGLALVRPTIDRARATSYAPLVARLLLVEGRLVYGTGDYAGAEPMLHEAAATAIEAHEDLVAADAWTTLVRVTGTLGGRVAEARAFARYAEVAIARAGGDVERDALRLRYLATVVWRRERKLEEARAMIERARALFRSSQGPRFDFEVTSCDEGIAGIDFDSGRPDLALPLHRSVAEVRTRLFGADHPSVGTALVNIGEDLTLLGRPAEAVPLLRRSVAIAAQRADKGADGYPRHRLAAALRANGDARGALEEDERARAAASRAGETGGYWESFALTGIGLDLLALGRPSEAVEPLERAVALRTKGAPACELSESRFALARALWEGGDAGARARARAVAEEARDDLQSDAKAHGGSFAASREAIVAWLARSEK